METTKQRPALQSILFILKDCIDSFDSLKELDRFHKQIMLMKSEQREALPISSHLIPHIIGAVRDHFCIRLRNLVDPREDSYSLKEYYTEPQIKKLEGHPIMSSAIKAAKKNVAHIDKEYTQWPSVESILSSDIKEILETIRVSIWLTR